jgi:ribonuclease-3
MSSLPEVLVRLPDRPPDDELEEPEGRRASIRAELEGLAGLQTALEVRFQRPALLRVALTVGSWANENRGTGWPSNASLEFFGDAVLDLVAADALWRAFPSLGEGPLTRLRASLVSEASLTAAAREIGLGRWLYVGRGDERRGARERDGTLADALEAVIGAVFLDARESGQDGAAAAGALFDHLFGARLRSLEPDDGLDVKSRLQQLVQARHRVTPTYRAIGEPPPPDDPHWRARVEISISGGDVKVLGEGDGRSLRDAERAAAVDALARIDGRARDA